MPKRGAGERSAITGRIEGAAQVEAALRGAQLRQLVELAPDVIVVVDAKGRITLVNAEAEELFGYSRDELLGQPVEILLPQRLRQTHVRHRVGFSSHPSARPMGARLNIVARRKDGSEFPVDIKLAPVETDEGVLVTSVIRDISDRKRAEGALRESEEWLSTTLNSIGDAVIATDRNGRVKYLNPAAQALTGWSQEEALGKPLQEVFNIVSEEADAPLENPATKVIREGVVVGLANHTLLIAKDGARRPIDDSGAPIRDCEGNIRGVVVVFHDVSERRRAEEALGESEDRLRTVIAGAPIVLFAVDRRGVFTLSEGKGLDALGLRPGEVVGRSVFDVYRDVPQILANVRRALAGEALTGIVEVGRLTFEARYSPLRGPKGEAIGVIGVATDITERKQAEEERNQLLQELERLSHRLLYVQEEERRQLAYDIHDGPTQQIVAAHMYLETYRSEKQQREEPRVEACLEQAQSYLGTAIQESRRIISDLRPTVLDDFGLAEALRHYLDEVRARTDRQVEFHSDANGPRLDPAAETALFRIAQEAVTNVLKHSGTERLSVALRQTPSGLTLEVRDWGQGFNVPQTLSAVGGGRQVGLLSMKERAQLAGGGLTIESTPGEGTTVKVALPITQREEGDEGRLIMAVQRGRKGEGRRPGGAANGRIRVLIADDHPMVRQGLRSMLDTREIEVVGEAADGREAVERVRELNPDVVLMDVRMPDMDGLAATEIVKQEAPSTAVIMVTSYESKDYLRRAIQAGAAGYLLKGMSRDSLIEAIKLVKGGGSLLDAKLLAELLQEIGVEGEQVEGPRAGLEEGALETLSPREREILQLLVQGLTNKEIAREVHYSVGTVKNVVQRIIEKLGVSDRTQAAVYAVRAGLGLR